MIEKYLQRQPDPVEALQNKNGNLSEILDFIANYHHFSRIGKNLYVNDMVVTEGDWVTRDKWGSCERYSDGAFFCIFDKVVSDNPDNPESERSEP